MKCLVLFLLVAIIAVQAIPPEKLPKFERGVRNIIEKLKNGDTELPLRLPSLRPLMIQPTTTKYRAFTMDISEATVEGLRSLQVEAVRASRPEAESVDLAVSLAFSVPTKIVATADQYHLVGSIIGIPIDDSGLFKAEVNNLKAVATVQLARRGSGTTVVGLDLDFTADVEVKLGGAGPIITNFLNSILRDLLSDRDSEVFAKAKEVVTQMVNEYLRSYTPSQLRRLVERES